jgi:predicted negative regulator of RcsB-dependent stress response
MDNATDDMHEQLVDYLDGNCTADEKLRVKFLLGSDPQWQQAWQKLLETREAINQYGLRQKVASIHKEMIQELRIPVRGIGPARRTLRSVISVAAALILIAGGFFIYKFYTLSSDKVVAEYFYHYELSTTRGENAPESEIEKAYRANDMAKVTRLFPRSDSVSLKDRFLSAEAFYELGNLDKAIAEYKLVLATDSSTLFRDEAQYYLALAYVANKDFDLALPLLRNIRNNKLNTYHERVDSRLIRQVKMLKWR